MSSDLTPAWPEAWAALYDAMDVDRSLHLSFYASLATTETTSLLDLGCGTGTITMHIAANMAPDARVVGVDLSAKMVEIARTRAPGATWVEGDLMDPPVSGSFDLIVICFHTVQVLLRDEQLAACFAAVRRLLAPGGRFAFDLYQPNLDWLAQVDPGPAIARVFTDARGRVIEVVEDAARYDAQARVLSGEWRLRDQATGQILPVEPIIQRVRQFFPADIRRALADAGLKVIQSFGELDRRPLEPRSKRQVYICGAAD